MLTYSWAFVDTINRRFDNASIVYSTVLCDK